MLSESRRDPGVCKLQQRCTARAEKHGALPVDLPSGRFRPKEAVVVVAGHSLELSQKALKILRCNGLRKFAHRD